MAKERNLVGNGPRSRWGLRVVSMIVGLIVASRSTSLGAGDVPLTSPRCECARPARFDLEARAQRSWQDGLKAERSREPTCVARYYRAAVLAYAAMVESSRPGSSPAPGLQELYDTSLAACLRVASAYARFDPRCQLRFEDEGRAGDVPIEHIGFVWRDADFSRLIAPEEVSRDPERTRRHQRAGLGCPLVAERSARGGASDPFLIDRHAFPVTAVLYPDLDAWLGRAARVPRDRLVLYDPLRVGTVAGPGGVVPLAADFDASISRLRENLGGSRSQVASLLYPQEMISIAKLFFLEPYQPGKIPVILIHGLASSSMTWDDLIGDLRSSPHFQERFQLWLFAYPTGLPFLRNATILRQALERIGPTLDPNNMDPALHRIVLVGHSMGGLIARVQVSSSGTALWDKFSRVPLGAMAMPPAARNILVPAMFFEPQRRVKTVVFIATPHRGSSLANRAIGRMGSILIHPPDDSVAMLEQLRAANPEAIYPWCRRLPTSIDLLEVHHPLLDAILDLPHPPDVAFHSIIGIHHGVMLDGDGIVPATSAHLDGVASEVLVPARHSKVHHDSRTVAEVSRILEEFVALPGLSGATSGPQAIAIRPGKTW